MIANMENNVGDGSWPSQLLMGKTLVRVRVRIRVRLRQFPAVHCFGPALDLFGVIHSNMKKKGNDVCYSQLLKRITQLKEKNKRISKRITQENKQESNTTYVGLFWSRFHFTRQNFCRLESNYEL